ncbi:MAG: DUF11 domain-containing protein [Methanothrix sp.]|uniref:DUF11 domain-containing protein n=1 Tax=Methanothrix sp. TaxID=90426 RepID=UPI0032AECF50|nr:DUF11 domain-containing protein [Methanothrix sp.]
MTLLSSRIRGFAVMVLLVAACSADDGRSITLTGPEGDYIYHWIAQVDDEVIAQGDERIFTFQLPETPGKRVKVTLLVKSIEGGCVNSSSIEIVTGQLGRSEIHLDKDCVYTKPVHVGDSVIYTYNVSNTGESDLFDLNLTDSHSWGPGCEPVYISGDDGDGVLNPGETWHYEARFTLPDPRKYGMTGDAVLSIMAAPDTGEIVRSLLKRKQRLEAKLSIVRERQRSFNLSRAQTFSYIRQRLRFENHTNSITGEYLLESFDAGGALISKEYSDPISRARLRTEYRRDGRVSSEECLFELTREYIKIEYDAPSPGYKTYTITDYTTGDTLIAIQDPFGNIVSKEYRRTPGYRVYEERVMLTNIATVTARDASGLVVSAIDTFTLDVLRPLPALRVYKSSDPEIAFRGSFLNYTISYENAGSEDAHGVVIREHYDGNFSFISSYPPPDSGTNVWNIGDLRAGESGTIRILGRTSDEADLITNRVEIRSADGSGDEYVLNTTVVSTGLNISKSASPGLVVPGSRLTYRIKYSNDGSYTHKDVRITDILDPTVEYLSASPAPSHTSGNTYTWSIPELAPGAGGEIEIKVLVGSTDRDFIVNTYRIDSDRFTGVNSTLITGVIQSLWVNKSSDKDVYAPGEDVVFTVRFGNKGNYEAHDVNLTDVLPDLELISASGNPSARGRTLVWNIGDLRSGENGTVVITMRVPERSNLIYNESSSVSGEGFVRVRKRFSTAIESKSHTNRAYITGYYSDDGRKVYHNASTSKSITVAGDPGSEIRTGEHGSGYYEEELLANLNLSSRNVSVEKDLFAEQRPTSFSLPRRKIEFRSSWFESTESRNRNRGEMIEGSYMYARSLDLSSRYQADPNQTTFREVSEVEQGVMRIRYVSRDTSSLIDERYAGSFRSESSIDSYGSGLAYRRASSGEGFVGSELRAGSMESRESGSGYYRSDLIRQTEIMKRDLEASSSDVNTTLDGREIRFSSLWHESSMTEDRSRDLAMMERITHARYIRMESELSRSTLSMLGEFEGRGEIRATMGRPETLRVEQDLAGMYTVDLAVSVYAVPKHLYPHINITKMAVPVDENNVLFIINVTNDGNEPLRDVIVRDVLPEGLEMINSTLRPSMEGRCINWSIPLLEISRRMEIRLFASMDPEIDIFENHVNVAARAEKGDVSAEASVRFDREWLSCCIGSTAENLTAENRTLVLPESYSCIGMNGSFEDCEGAIDEVYDEMEKRDDCTKGCI